MATRRAPTPEETVAAFVQVPGTAVQIHDEETSIENLPTEEDDIAARLRGVMGSAQSDNVRVKLYRRSPLSRKMEWCDDYAPDQVEAGAHELIRATWGAGAYELRVTGSTGTLAKILIDIAPRPERLTPQPPPPAVSDALAGVLERMADAQAQILARLSAPPPPAPPPMGMTEMLGQLATAKNLFSQPPAPPQAGIVEMAQQMRALKQLGEEFSPPPPDPDNPMSMVNGLLNVVGEAIKSRAPQPQPQPMPTLQPPMSTLPDQFPAADGAADGAAETTEENTTRQFMEGIAQGVIEHATQNKPHTECANWLAEVLPDEFLPALKLPNWLDLLCGAMPAMTAHRDYLTAVKPHLDAELIRLGA